MGSRELSMVINMGYQEYRKIKEQELTLRGERDAIRRKIEELKRQTLSLPNRSPVIPNMGYLSQE